ncbi:MAG TPA: ParA family protein [Streptosporangiaceae bacterium]|jgi:chromosome partitioning protein
MARPTLDLPQPLVVTIGNLKGGAGKSTSSVFLACYFARRGLRVLIIDADPLSQTAYSWHRALVRNPDVTNVPFEMVPFPSAQVGDCIDDQTASGKYDVIIVDTGGESDKILKAAVRKSHELIITSAPNDAETERIPTTFDEAKAALAGTDRTVNVRVLLVKVPPMPSKEGERARDKLDEAGYVVFEAQATNWQWYRQAKNTTNPIDDLAEFQDVGGELVAEYEVAA